MSKSLSAQFQKIRAINERYKKPRMEMSKPVRVALFCIRVYLLLLVGLMMYKFITIVVG